MRAPAHHLSVPQTASVCARSSKVNKPLIEFVDPFSAIIRLQSLPARDGLPPTVFRRHFNRFNYKIVARKKA